MAIFMAAMIVRFAADSQPESVRGAPIRLLLLAISYALIGIGFVSLLFMLFLNLGFAIAELALFMLAVSQLIDIELKIAGKRRQAQQAELLWVLATTVTQGGNLAADLDGYAQSCWGPRRRRLMDLARRIRQGTPLSEIVVPQGLLPASATLEIQAGMRSGRLHEALRSAAFRQTRELVDDSQVGRTQFALMYPAAMVTATALLVGFLMYYIIPKFKKLFDDFGTELPQITKTLISAADNVMHFGLLIWPLVVLPMILLVVTSVAQFYGWRVVSQKLIGFWFARAHAADLLRFMSQAVASGRPLNQSLEGLAYAGVPRLMQKRVSLMIAAMLRGEPCWRQLSRQRFLRRNEVVLLEAAEKVGNLPWAMNAIADGIERRWYYRFQAMMEIFGPMVIVLMGMIVGFIALGMFMPLVKLLNDLS